MLDSENSVLMTKYNLYYEAAKKCENENDFLNAKNNYIMAAKVMLSLAENASNEVKKSRIKKVQLLIEKANSLSNNKSTFVNDKKVVENKEETFKKAEIPNVHFSDIAGLEDVKKTIYTRMIYPIKYKDKYELYNKKTGGGILLYGPPGTGKTMIAKAIACEVGAAFYVVKGSDIVSKWVGDSEKNIKELFQTASKQDLAIIFIDEVDTLLHKRGDDVHNDQRVNEFLQHMDGFTEKNKNLLILAATNNPWDIDNAAIRTGRFSEKIYVPLPDEKARKFLLEKSFKKETLSNEIDLNKLVEMTEGLAGSDIDELCDRAKENPLLDYIKTNNPRKIEMKDFEYAFQFVRPSTTKKMLEKYEEFAGEKLINKEIKENIKVKENNFLFIPNSKYQIEFSLNNDYEFIYIMLNNNKYIAKKINNNYLIENIEISQSGKYLVEVFENKKIGEFEIEFHSGIIDEDLGV